MALVTVLSNETGVAVTPYSDSSFSFTIPAITGTVYDARLYSNVTFTGEEVDFIAEVVRDDAYGAQMHKVSAGERVSDGFQGLGTYVDRYMSGWNGLDPTNHPAFGTDGQIWESIKSLAGAGGTLTLTYQMQDRVYLGANDGYYFEQMAGAAVSGTVANLKLRIYYSSDVPEDANLQFCSNSISAAKYKDTVITARVLSFDNSTDDNAFIGVSVHQLNPKKCVLDSYFMELGKPKLHSPIGVLFDQHGTATLRYEDKDSIPVYLQSSTMGVGSTYVSGHVDWKNSLGAWIEIPTIECTDAWTPVSGSWAEGAVLTSCMTRERSFCAVTHTVTGASGHVDLQLVEYDPVGAWGTPATIAENITLGTKYTYYNLDGSIDYTFIKVLVGGAGAAETSTGVMATYKSGDYSVMRKYSRDWVDWTAPPTEVRGSIGPMTEVGTLFRSKHGIVAMGGQAYLSTDDGLTFKTASSAVLADVFFEAGRFYSVGAVSWDQIDDSWGLAWYQARYPSWLIARYAPGGVLINRALIPRIGGTLYSLDECSTWVIAPFMA